MVLATLGTIAASTIAQQVAQKGLGSILGGGTTGNTNVVRSFNLPQPRTLEDAVFNHHMTLTCNRGHIDPGQVPACEANARLIAQNAQQAFNQSGVCPPYINGGDCSVFGANTGIAGAPVATNGFGVGGSSFFPGGGVVPSVIPAGVVTPGQVTPAVGFAAPLVMAGGRAALQFLAKPVVQGLLLGIGGDLLLNSFLSGNAVRLPGGSRSLGKPPKPRYCNPCSIPRVYVGGRRGGRCGGC